MENEGRHGGMLTEGGDMLITQQQAARELGCAATSLYRQSYLDKLGIRVVMVGKRRKYFLSEVRRAIKVEASE